MAVRTQSLRLGANPAPSHHLSVIARTDLPIRAPYRFGGLAPRDLSLCVPPSLITATQRDRNTNRLSITYAFRPRLRPASPAVDQHGCGTLGHSVEQIHTALALLVPTFALLTPPGDPFPAPFTGGQDAPLPCRNPASAASVPNLAPVDCRCRGTIDQ